MFRPAIRSSLAALAMAIAAGTAVTSAVAAPDATPAATAHRHGPKVDRYGLWIPGLGSLSKAQVDALKLDTNQQALLNKARDASRQAMHARREASRSQHERLDAQLKAGKFDPRALAVEGDKTRQQFEGQRIQLRDQWLAVWDSLNDGQRAQVTQIIKDRAAKGQERYSKRHHGRAGQTG